MQPLVAALTLVPISFMHPSARISPVHRLASVSSTGPARFAKLSMEAAASDIEEICDAIPTNECEQIELEAAAIFAVIDVDGNGGISREELMAHLTQAGYAEKAVNVLFDKLDTNKDDSISLDELAAGLLQYTPLRSAPGLGGYNAEFIADIHTDADALFAAIDGDNNGSISKDELRDHLKRVSNYSFKAISKIFGLLDVNKDGGVEKDELRAAFVKYSALRLAIGEGPTFK